jgi:multidrug efflux pump subunit AcrB
MVFLGGSVPTGVGPSPDREIKEIRMNPVKKFFQDMDRTCANLMAVTFVGIHVPMISLVLYGIMNGFTGLFTILVTLVVATGLSTAVSLTIIYLTLNAPAEPERSDVSLS